ncbi:MAG: hypothetical protein WCY57_07815, partial [Micavibrio sp.]
GPAMIFGAALATGLNLDDVENWPQDIAKVTKERVHEAARKYLNPASPWIRPPARGHLLPQDKTKAAQTVQNKRINKDAANVEE